VDLVTPNALLAQVDAATLAQLACAPIQVRAGEVLLQPWAAETHAYFPVTAVFSLISTMEGGESAEVAIVGREGMIGLAGVLGGGESATTCVARVSGSCLRVSAAAVRACRQRGGMLRAVLDRYTTSRLIQVAQVSACSRLHQIGGRLARWLLDLQDRVGDERLHLPQQSIADSMGVHRPTIAVELQKLHAAGAIVYRDRIVTIANRPRLEALACECHAALHREFENLFTPITDPGVPAGEPGAADVAVLRDIAGRLLVASLREQEARERAEAARDEATSTPSGRAGLPK
jgi:CRP-like cAMP-binding protein